MAGRGEAIQIINGLSDKRYEYVINMLRDVARIDKMERQKGEGAKAFDELTQLFQELPDKGWESEEEMIKDMADFRRERIANANLA